MEHEKSSYCMGLVGAVGLLCSGTVPQLLVYRALLGGI